MAWTTSHQGLDGATYWYLHCRRCLPRCRAMGPLQEADARSEVARHDADVHGREGGRREASSRALDAFLASREASTTPGTVRYYKASLGPWVASMGARPMSTWRRSDVEAWIVRHRAWSPRSKQKFVAQVKTFAAWCGDEGIALGGALDGMRLPKVARRRRDPLGAENVRALIDAAKGHPWLELPVTLAATTGLALGDLRHLDWRDVDLRAGRIMRNRVKSGRPLDLRVGAVLAGALRRVRERERTGPVCRGMPTSDSAVSKAVRALYADAGVPRVKGQGLHYLRTAFVSIGLAATGDLTAVADVVGDAPDVVSRHYAQSGRAARDAIVEAVDAALRGGG